MRILRWLLVWFAAALVVGTAGAADVLFPAADILGAPTISRPLRIIPQDAPRVSGGNIITAERFSTNTGSGQVIVSNLTAGRYRIEIAGVWTNTIFTIAVPDTNALVDARTILTAPTNSPAAGLVAWSAAAADLRYAFKGEAGTNSTASVFTLDGDGNLTPSTTVSSDAYWETVDGNLTPK